MLDLDISYAKLLLGLHAGAVFTVDTTTVWMCRLCPFRQKLGMLTVRLMVRNGATRAIKLRYLYGYYGLLVYGTVYTITVLFRPIRGF